MPSSVCHTLTAALSAQPSNGNVASRPVSAAWAPMPAGKPPAKSRAADSENWPSGSISNVVTSAGAIQPLAPELDHLRSRSVVLIGRPRVERHRRPGAQALEVVQRETGRIVFLHALGPVTPRRPRPESLHRQGRPSSEP